MLQKKLSASFKFVASSASFGVPKNGEAELDLLFQYKGQKIGFEFKHCDFPKMTRSMKTAKEDLMLDALYVITPKGDHTKIAEGVIC